MAWGVPVAGTCAVCCEAGGMLLARAVQGCTVVLSMCCSCGTRVL